MSIKIGVACLTLTPSSDLSASIACSTLIIHFSSLFSLDKFSINNPCPGRYSGRSYSLKPASCSLFLSLFFSLYDPVAYLECSCEVAASALSHGPCMKPTVVQRRQAGNKD